MDMKKGVLVYIIFILTAQNRIYEVDVNEKRERFEKLKRKMISI